MKKLLLLICLCLCFKSYSQSSVLDSSLTIFRDSINNASFYYPKNWDTTFYAKMRSGIVTQEQNFLGALLVVKDSISPNGFFSYKSYRLPDETSLEMILEINTHGTPEILPQAIVTKHVILETKNKSKCAYVEAKDGVMQIQDFSMKGITFIEAVFTKGKQYYDFRFSIREGNISQYRNSIDAILNSFQFDK